MKKKLSLLAVLFLVCALPLSSFTIEKNHKKPIHSAKKKFTVTYFGSFVTSSYSYDVWGDASTNTVTYVSSCCPEAPVNSFTATYDGVVINISGYNTYNQAFSYHGRLSYL